MIPAMCVCFFFFFQPYIFKNFDSGLEKKKTTAPTFLCASSSVICPSVKADAQICTRHGSQKTRHDVTTEKRFIHYKNER